MDRKLRTKRKPELGRLKLFKSELASRVRGMRRSPTIFESIFAERLIDAGIPFLDQVPIGQYIADFVIPHALLVVEIDGSHHLTPKVREYDRKRDYFLECHGMTVIRIQNKDVMDWDLRIIEVFPEMTEGIKHVQMSAGVSLKARYLS